MQGDDPFDRADYVAHYEDWYSTPFGRVADRLEGRMIRELLAPLSTGASVLEIGCGTAHFGSQLRGEGWRVVGCDPSLAMTRVAARRTPPLLGVVQANGQRLPFVDRAFDAALLVAVLEFVDDPVALLAEARRVARSRIVVLTVARWSYLGMRRCLVGRLGHPVFARARYKTLRGLVSIAAQSGARVERVTRAIYLPPALAGRLGWLEERLAPSNLPGGGIVGFALDGGA